jgi:hypothetical protein
MATTVVGRLYYIRQEESNRARQKYLEAQYNDNANKRIANESLRKDSFQMRLKSVLLSFSNQKMDQANILLNALISSLELRKRKK